MKKKIMNYVLPVYMAGTKKLLEGHEDIENKYYEVSDAYARLEKAYDEYKKRVDNNEKISKAEVDFSKWLASEGFDFRAKKLLSGRYSFRIIVRGKRSHEMWTIIRIRFETPHRIFFSEENSGGGMCDINLYKRFLLRDRKEAF